MKQKSMMMALPLIVFALFLTACESVGGKTINNVPSELLVYEDRPAPPTGEFEQGEFGEYAVELDTELKQCNEDKKAIERFIEKISKE